MNLYSIGSHPTDIDAYLRRCSVLISVLYIFNCNELDGKSQRRRRRTGLSRDEIIINDHDHAFFGLITLLDSGCMTQSNGRRSAEEVKVEAEAKNAGQTIFWMKTKKKPAQNTILSVMSLRSGSDVVCFFPNSGDFVRSAYIIGSIGVHQMCVFIINGFCVHLTVIIIFFHQRLCSFTLGNLRLWWKRKKE